MWLCPYNRMKRLRCRLVSISGFFVLVSMYDSAENIPVLFTFFHSIEGVAI